MKVERTADSLGTSYDLLGLTPAQMECIIQALRRDAANLRREVAGYEGTLLGRRVTEAAIERKEEIINTINAALR
ncbi:MAG: hypothetical protein QY325_04200 [Flavobacteriales bacterium]|nr:MAG: hypothetical protein QY325_04200 [Flavobacteriales bacterium]